MILHPKQINPVSGLRFLIKLIQLIIQHGCNGYLSHLVEKMTLAEIKPGQQCTVVSFTDEFLKLKLMEMGCLPGEVVKVISLAPPGDPMAISVSNYVLAIRMNEARTILVEPFH